MFVFLHIQWTIEMRRDETRRERCKPRCRSSVVRFNKTRQTECPIVVQFKLVE